MLPQSYLFDVVDIYQKIVFNSTGLSLLIHIFCSSWGKTQQSTETKGYEDFFMEVLLYDLGHAFYICGSLSADTSHVFNVTILSYLRKIR